MSRVWALRTKPCLLYTGVLSCTETTFVCKYRCLSFFTLTAILSIVAVSAFSVRSCAANPLLFSPTTTGASLHSPRKPRLRDSSAACRFSRSKTSLKPTRWPCCPRITSCINPSPTGCNEPLPTWCQGLSRTRSTRFLPTSPVLKAKTRQSSPPLLRIFEAACSNGWASRRAQASRPRKRLPSCATILRKLTHALTAWSIGWSFPSPAARRLWPLPPSRKSGESETAPEKSWRPWACERCWTLPAWMQLLSAADSAWCWKGRTGRSTASPAFLWRKLRRSASKSSGRAALRKPAQTSTHCGQPFQSTWPTPSGRCVCKNPQPPPSAFSFIRILSGRTGRTMPSLSLSACHTLARTYLRSPKRPWNWSIATTSPAPNTRKPASFSPIWSRQAIRLYVRRFLTGKRSPLCNDASTFRGCLTR